MLGISSFLRGKEVRTNIFQVEFAREKKLIIILIIGEIVFILLSLIFALINHSFGNPITFWFFLLGALLFGVILLILFTRYSVIPIISNKRILESNHRQATKELNQTRSKIKEITRTRSSLHSQRDHDSAGRRKLNDQRQAQFAQQHLQINQSESNELAASLGKLQTEYVLSGMQNSSLQSAQIAGIGPKTISLLNQNGIRAAADINYNRIVQIPGVGDSKAQALVSWSRGVYKSLDMTKPGKLAADIEKEIRNKHLAWRNQVEDHKLQENKDFSEDLERINQTYAARHQQNDENEKKYQEQADLQRGKLQSIHQALDPFRAINFRYFLITSLKSLGYTFQVSEKRVMISGGAILSLLVLSQLTLGIKSTMSFIASSIPTLTPTVTPSFTPTLTLKPTNTRTPTNTLTPTVTLTPTNSQTPTQTETPTITPTFTRTSTITKTITPTSAYPQGATALCNDGTFSTSQTHSGACSHHGGVLKWLP